MTIEFVSEEFIQNENDVEIREWRKFFENQKDKIVQRIGILTALNYEKRREEKQEN